MKLAMAQTVVSSDIAANGAAIRAMIRHAAVDGARLIGFCEGALSGYSKLQILSPSDCATFDWTGQEAELRSIAALCGELHIHAVIGAAHRLADDCLPHNSLYVFSDLGTLTTRYDKRFLSNSEVGDWYAPGRAPVILEVDGYSFGCALCIECQFPEIFSEYERMGVDGVIFASYGLPEHFQIALRAHAGLNCLWIGTATPAQKAPKGPAGIIGPDGRWIGQCSSMSAPGMVIATLDRCDPLYDVALQKARPWRAKARQGDIYLERMVDHPRSRIRQEY
ncbi:MULTISPECIES: carbon-nitrogen hydrolase family protein [unclassified Rhizobium]|uniref:carbon-nitrogen hydrolase family protein n=1 Tax=unclassified Rhizobium TaxID=2613769 RepID=UPI000714E8C7|nr:MULTISPECIES: carbon-nitrogen hydrolase family protein [unclassified Rhizobium]KQS98166.1 hydrolase [Rhizobium sp. Leaf386]KQT00429.1 hydrolase [Rhizobium sp. Leaf391]KQT97432.1 hydrolase [Rhizobium sp. Leaf453]